jgi:hypothetical protein
MESKWIFRKSLEGHLGAERAWRKKKSFLYKTSKNRNLLQEKIRFSRLSIETWRKQFGISEEVYFPAPS